MGWLQGGIGSRSRSVRDRARGSHTDGGSVQIFSHFRSCDGGSVGFVRGRAERRHVHVFAG
jgi:hypothetical protein